MDFYYVNITIPNTDPLIIQGQISIIEAQKKQLEREITFVSSQPDEYRIKTLDNYISKADWLAEANQALADMTKHIEDLQAL